MRAPDDVQERVRPESLSEARDAVLDGAADRTALLFRGAGTKLDWGAAPSRTDVILETGGLDRLLAHDPGDMTATVEAGMSLARLQSELAEAGQWLAIDAVGTGEAADATVGGMLAANAYGPRRLRYGSMRDNVIGITVVLSDGTVARSGGKVIKNVAGYDLGKLFCGSLGTLGLVAEVVLRLHPLSEASTTLRVGATADEALPLVLAVMSSPVEPSAIDWVGDPGGPGALWVRLEGHGPGLEAQRRHVETLAAEYRLEAGTLESDEEQAAWDGMVTASAGADGETIAAVATLPDRLPEVARSLAGACEEAGTTATLHSHAALGLHTARFPRRSVPGAHAAAVSSWRRQLRPLGATVVLRTRPPGVDARVDPWGLEDGGDLAAMVPLMRAVKLRLDPGNRCAPGRHLGGV